MLAIVLCVQLIILFFVMFNSTNNIDDKKDRDGGNKSAKTVYTCLWNMPTRKYDYLTLSDYICKRKNI